MPVRIGDRATQGAVAIWAIVAGLVITADETLPDSWFYIDSPLDGLPDCLAIGTGMLFLLGGIMLTAGLVWWGQNLRTKINCSQLGWNAIAGSAVTSTILTAGYRPHAVLTTLWTGLLVGISCLQWWQLYRWEKQLEAQKDLVRKAGEGIV